MCLLWQTEKFLRLCCYIIIFNRHARFWRCHELKLPQTHLSWLHRGYIEKAPWEVHKHHCTFNINIHTLYNATLTIQRLCNNYDALLLILWPEMNSLNVLLLFFYYYKLHLFESSFGLHWFSSTPLSAQCNTGFVVAPARVKYELLVLLRGFCWTCLKNCYIYIYISAVSQPQGPECWLQLLFLTVFMRILACGWHRLICLGLGTNAQKHSVDGTRSQALPGCYLLFSMEVCVFMLPFWNLTLNTIFCRSVITKYANKLAQLETYCYVC